MASLINNLPPNFSFSETNAFSLVILPITHCAGGYVEGEVVLEFFELQREHIEEVVVELHGMVMVSLSHGGSHDSTGVKRNLVSLEQSLWRKGSSYPPGDSHVLLLPFRFHLPSTPEILPSKRLRDDWGDQLTILYYVDAIGLRPTLLHPNKRTIRKPIAVVPRGDPSLIQSIRFADKPDGGPTWKTECKEVSMRRGLWGEYSTARVELLVPNQYGILPLFTVIPVVIKIKTTTPRLTRAKADKHPLDRPIFPALEMDCYPMSIRLRQTLVLRVRGETSQNVEEISSTAVRKDDMLPTEYRQWVDDTRKGDKEAMGRWVQQWMLQSHLRLNVTPTFSCDLVDCSYALRVTIQFQGMGNEVTVDMPITIDSGMDQTVAKGRAPTAHPAVPSKNTQAPIGGVAAGPPRSDDPSGLPPAYWEVEYRDAGIIMD